MLCVNFVRRGMGMLLLLLLLRAVSLILFHSLCQCTSLRGSDSILFINNL